MSINPNIQKLTSGTAFATGIMYTGLISKQMMMRMHRQMHR